MPKTISQVDLKKMIDNRPAGSTPGGIIAALRQRGVQMEGYDQPTMGPPMPPQFVPAHAPPTPPPATSSGPAMGNVGMIGQNVRQFGQDLLQTARGVNKQMPVIGGTIGSVLGAAPGVLGTPETGGLSVAAVVPGMAAGGALGAAAGRAIEQQLARVLGQPEEVPSSAMQAINQQGMSAIGGALPIKAEEAIGNVAPILARRLAQLSLRNGYGDPEQLAKTMVQYGIENTRKGVQKVVDLVRSFSDQHAMGLNDIARTERPTWGMSQDYFQPVFLDLRRAALNSNDRQAMIDQAKAEIESFAAGHKIPTGKMGPVGISTSSPDYGIGTGGEYGRQYRDRTLGLKQLNALKEDADGKLRLLRESIDRRTIEATPEVQMRQRVLEGLADRARTLMYGDINPTTGLREGGPAARLQGLDQQQHQLLTLKTNIGPGSRRDIDAMTALGQRGIPTVASMAAIGGAGMAAGHNPLVGGVGALGGGLLGNYMMNPEQLSGMSYLMSNPLLASHVANIIRSGMAGLDAAGLPNAITKSMTPGTAPAGQGRP
jgi:hypothetical protein